MDGDVNSEIPLNPSVNTPQPAELSQPEHIPHDPHKQEKMLVDTDEITDQNVYAFHALLHSPEGPSLLAQYSEALEQGADAISHVQKMLEGVKGAELIHSAAHHNLAKQAGLYLMAAAEIKRNGSATVSHFGDYKTLHSMQEVEKGLEQIVRDFQTINGLPETFQSFRDQGLAVIDKYLFDGRNIEQSKGSEVRTVVIMDPSEDRWGKNFVDRLKKDGIIPDSYSLDHQMSLEDKELHKEKFVTTILPDRPLSFFYRTYHTSEEVPEIIVLHAANPQSLRKYHQGYQAFYSDYLDDVFVRNSQRKHKPIVIMYTDGFTPKLYEKSRYDQFLFASNPDELRNTYHLAKDLALLNDKPTFLEPVALAAAQEKLYDNSDLREWEHHTADTKQSLEHLLQTFKKRDESIPRGDDERKIKTILDCGTGEGRIAGMLARLGYNVLGVDISQKQLDRVPVRIEEEGRGLRGEAEDSALSYAALKQIDPSLLPQEPILSDIETREHYLTAKGDFLNLPQDVGEAVMKFYSTMSPDEFYDFFGLNIYDPGPAVVPEEPLQNIGFGAITYNWHTSCELGGMDLQEQAMGDAFYMLERGGLLFLEIPDRLVGPYAESLNDYHKRHPDEPLGTIRDATSTEAGESTTVEDESQNTPRFFADRNQIVQALQARGFVNVEVKTYLITSKDEQTGEEHLQAKELVIVAQKPWK